MAGPFDVTLRAPAGGFDIPLGEEGPAAPGTVLSENRRRAAVMHIVLNAMPIPDTTIDQFDRLTAGWLYPLPDFPSTGGGAEVVIDRAFLQPWGILG